MEATFTEDIPILEMVVEYLENLSALLHTSGIWIRGMSLYNYCLGEEMSI